MMSNSNDCSEVTREASRVILTEFNSGFNAVAFAPDSQILMLGTRTEGLKMWIRQTSRVEPVCGKTNTAVSAIEFHPQLTSIGLAALHTGELFKVDLSVKKYEEYAFEDVHPVNTLVFNPAGAEFLTAGNEGTLRVYDYETRFVKTSYDGIHRGASAVFAAKYWPLNSKVFISGGSQPCLKVWDSRVGDRPIKMIQGPLLAGSALDISGYRVLSGSYVKSGGLQLWDLGTGRLLRELPFQNKACGDYITCAKFWKSNLALAGSTTTRNVQIFDFAKDSGFLAELQAGMPVTTFDMVHQAIAVGGLDSCVKLFDLSGT